MKKALKRIVIVLAIPLLSTIFSMTAHADQPTTFLGPTAKVSYTSPITVNTAYSVLGEAGWRNFRLGGTVGYRFDDNSRIKLSGEYLWQKIAYRFTSGSTDQWVQQGALGTDYQYSFPDLFMRPTVELSAYLSQAESKSLSNISGEFISPVTGLMVPFTDVRRLAGSHARGIRPGASISPRDGTRIAVSLDFDQIHYDKETRPFESASGLGGTLDVTQSITRDIDLGLTASDRKIYNYYAGNLTWKNARCYGDWTLGIFGDYVTGKKTLPNTWDAGISVNYLADYIVSAPLDYKFGYQREMEQLPCVAREYCLDQRHPYAMVINPNSPPVPLDSYPSEAGPQLPVVNAVFGQ